MLRRWSTGFDSGGEERPSPDEAVGDRLRLHATTPLHRCRRVCNRYQSLGRKSADGRRYSLIIEVSLAARLGIKGGSTLQVTLADTVERPTPTGQPRWQYLCSSIGIASRVAIPVSRAATLARPRQRQPHRPLPPERSSSRISAKCGCGRPRTWESRASPAAREGWRVRLSHQGAVMVRCLRRVVCAPTARRVTGSLLPTLWASAVSARKALPLLPALWWSAGDHHPQQGPVVVVDQAKISAPLVLLPRKHAD